MSDNKTHITGIILAGGKSSRMGTDKGLLQYNGKPFIMYSIEALKPLVSEIIIVSNDSAYDEFNYQRVEDIISNAGPLAGVYTGLYHSKTENNIILSCDVPLINSTILKKIANKINVDFDIVQVKSNNKSMPLIAAYKKRCAAKCLELLNSGERRLRIAVNQFKTKSIPLSKHLESFTMNINTPNEFENIKLLN